MFWIEFVPAVTFFFALLFIPESPRFLVASGQGEKARAVLGADGNLMLEGNAGLVALVAANLYVVFFNASWGPVMWVMLGEMFPNQIRGSGLAVSGLAQWGANFIITMTFPILLVGIGLGGAYGIYAICSLISGVFVIKYVHETKGRELEKMEG